MCHRNSSVGRTGNRRRDPGNDFKRYSSLRQLFRFLTTSPKDHRVTTLQAGNHFPLQRFFNNERVDLILGNGVIRRTLSGEDQFTSLLGPRHQFRTGECIINEDIAFLDTLFRLERDQAYISRTGAHQITNSLFAHDKFLKSSSATPSGSLPLASAR